LAKYPTEHEHVVEFCTFVVLAGNPAHQAYCILLLKTITDFMSTRTYLKLVLSSIQCRCHLRTPTLEIRGSLIIEAQSLSNQLISLHTHLFSRHPAQHTQVGVWPADAFCADSCIFWSKHTQSEIVAAGKIDNVVVVCGGHAIRDPPTPGQ